MSKFEQVRAWAEARNIIEGATAVSQTVKFASELGELAGHIDQMAEQQPSPEMSQEELISFGQHVFSIQKAMADDIGDAIVVLTIIGAQLGVNVEELPVDTVPSGNPFLKAVAATGLLCDAVLKNDIESFKGVVGVLFTLFGAMAGDLDLNLDQCLAQAYEEIKDRKGVMYNGTFIKDTDERFAAALADIESGKVALS